MRTFLILILLNLTAIYGLLAQTISLDSCIAWANQEQRFTENVNLIRQSQILAMESTAKMNLPNLVLDGMATYQNENITIETPPVPGFQSPNVPLNFNRLLINFNQTIYNGRLTSQKKLLDSLSFDSKAYEVAIAKAIVKAKITGLYSSIVLIKEQRKIIEEQMSTVEAKGKQLQGVIDAGVGYKSDLLNLKAEILNLKQNATELEYLERSLRNQLSNLTGHTINSVAELVLPIIVIDGDGVEARPELRLIESNKRTLLAQSSLSSASRMPYIGVFGNVGVGFPGYDIFKNSVSPMLMIGLKVNWKIIDWHKSKNDRQILSYSRDIVSLQYDRVKLQYETELVKQRQEMAKYEELITRDKEIVEMRKEVTQEISARLSGGTATSTDFLIQLNNEAVAELNQSIHLLKLALARINYSIIQGK